MYNNERIKWWRESRFGMFIHWGIYSLKGRGEWVMYIDRIPVRDYEKLAEQFNPVKFDAEEWVKLAIDAGMKYIVITAKHHDGFSMFKTKVDKYNIVDGTPYGKDIMADLAKACEKYGIRLCFYYSHVREWRHPHAQSLEMHSPFHFGNYGNFWDYPNENKKNLQIYIDEVDKPQLKELLTQYGPIGIIWFDTPSLIRPDQAQELIDIIRELQPDCLVNSRVGDFVDVDYYSLGDCEIPDFNAGVDFETPMTICDYWGYNTMPGNRYRKLNEIIRQLADIASLGGNYLLNVGPDPEGVIPSEAQELLRGIGKWMKVNGEAIYGTKASPFSVKQSWGRVTSTDNIMYLHIYEWDNTIKLTGIKSKVSSIQLLADPGREIKWKQERCGNLGYDRLIICLPGNAPDANVSVLKVCFDGELRVENKVIENDSGCIDLPACLADIHSSTGKPHAAVNITGVVKNWFSTDEWFSWDFLCEHPGEFDVYVTISTGFHGIWDFGHQLAVRFDDQEIRADISDDGKPTSGYQKRTFYAGKIQIDSEGLHNISLHALKISCAKRQGIQLSSVSLHPANE
jgi:alpha-L-fucosidase